MSLSMSLRASTPLTVPAWPSLGPPFSPPKVQDPISAQPGPSPQAQPAMGLGLPRLLPGCPSPWLGCWAGPWLPRGEPSSHMVPWCLGRDERVKNLQQALKSPWRGFSQEQQPHGTEEMVSVLALQRGHGPWVQLPQTLIWVQIIYTSCSSYLLWKY